MIPRIYFLNSADLWIENLRRDPLHTLCLTASILEKLRSALQSLSSSGLAKNLDSFWALKRVTSTNPGLFAAGYLWTFIKVCMPSTFAATCWSIALSAIHLLLYCPSYPWKGNTVILFIDDAKKCISSLYKRITLTTFTLL